MCFLQPKESHVWMLGESLCAAGLAEYSIVYIAGNVFHRILSYCVRKGNVLQFHEPNFHNTRLSLLLYYTGICRTVPYFTTKINNISSQSSFV